MGPLDLIILGITCTVLVISILLLVVSLISTKDEIRIRSYKRTYVPVILLCAIVLTLYFFILILGSYI